MQQQTYGDQAAEGLKALISLIGNNSPMSFISGIGAGASQGALNTPVGKDPAVGAVTGMANAVGVKEKQVLDPAQEGTKKAINDHYYDNAQQALQAGVPSGHIMDQVGINNNATAPQAEQVLQQSSPDSGNGNKALSAGAGLLKQLIFGSNAQSGRQASYQPPKLGLLDTLLPGLHPDKFAEAVGYGQARGQQMGGIPAKVAEAEKVGLTQAQLAERQAGVYSAQVTAHKDELDNLDKDIANQRELINTEAKFGWAKHGFANEAVKQRRQNIASLSKRRELVANSLSQLKPPTFKQNSTSESKPQEMKVGRFNVKVH